MGAIIGRQGRGELHSPQHVPTRDEGARPTVAGKWVSIEGRFVPGAIVVGGFASYPPHPFLVLIQEKGAKENQAPTGGGEAGRIRDGAIKMVPDAGGRRVGAIVGRQGRGELHSPQHVPTRDEGA